MGEALLRAVEADPDARDHRSTSSARTLSAPGRRHRVPSFPLDDSTRERFLEGLDDIGLTLRDADAIAAYEAGRPAWLPSAVPTG